MGCETTAEPVGCRHLQERLLRPADKVVGRATAFLYCLLGVSEVYPNVMRRPAAQVLARHGIAAHCGKLVEGIINRKAPAPVLLKPQ